MTDMLSASQQLKRKLHDGKTTFGLWVTLESPTVSEISAHLELDWICIDTEHGELDLQEVANHLRAIRRSSTAGLVRIQSIDQGLIQRVLGLGADGILVPRIQTADDVERAVCYAKYPPRGSRGMGVERATLWGRDIARANKANQDTMVIPLIETVDAGRNIDAIMQVDGVDAFFFGPADYSASAGHVGEWEGPGIANVLLQIKDRVRAHNYPCGIVATSPDNGKCRMEQGFRMIGLGVDCSLMSKMIVEMLNVLGDERN